MLFKFLCGLTVFVLNASTANYNGARGVPFSGCTSVSCIRDFRAKVYLINRSWKFCQISSLRAFGHIDEPVRFQGQNQSVNTRFVRRRSTTEFKRLWRHFGLCRAAAHSEWLLLFCAVYKYSYLLTYLRHIQ